MVHYRHHVVFTLLRPVFRLAFRLAFRYCAMPGPRLEYGRPALILANHNCAWDPFFVALSFNRPIYYIASDHIFRLGLISSIIRFLVSPIPIVKSQIDLRTQRQVRQVIREGGIIGLFPEGNRSFNGLTGWIPTATGKLVKHLRCPLFLYRITGGYLSTPRWSRYARRGRITGEVVKALQPGEISAMSPVDINSLISKMLCVDAFQNQHGRQAVAFIGKRPAEYLERVLFICPKCHSLSTLKSEDDMLFCSCGMQVRFNRAGLFEPVDAWSEKQAGMGSFLDTVAGWDGWQRQRLITMSHESEAIDWTGSRPIFTDENERIYNCRRASRSFAIGRGTLQLFADRLVFSGHHGHQNFPLSDLERVVVHGPQTLQFNTRDGRFLEVRSKQPRSAYKYVLLYHLLEQKRKGESHGFFGI